MAKPSDRAIAMAEVLQQAWAKAEPQHEITLHPTSYVATFLDMARAALAATPEGAQAVASVCIHEGKKYLKWTDGDYHYLPVGTQFYTAPPAASEDAARLDWVEANPGLLIRHADQWVAATNHPPTIHHDLDMRCVIDKAINAARSGGGGG